MILKSIFSAALVFSAFSFADAAASNMTNLEAMVIQDFNSVLSETYNEGEGSAEVAKAKCQTVKYTSKGSIAFCTIEVKVQPDASRRYKSTVECTSLGYEVSRNGKSVSNYTGAEECIESINNVTEF